MRAAKAAIDSAPDCACAKLRAKRTFEFEFAEQRFDAALELLVIGDGVCEVRAPYSLCFLRAEQSYVKVPSMVHGARAHAKIKLEIGNKSFNLVAGQLAKARFACQLK